MRRAAPFRLSRAKWIPRKLLRVQWKHSLSSLPRSPDGETIDVGGRVIPIPSHTVDKSATAAFRRRQCRGGRGCSRFIDIDAVGLLGHRHIIGILLQEAPALV